MLNFMVIHKYFCKLLDLVNFLGDFADFFNETTYLRVHNGVYTLGWIVHNRNFVLIPIVRKRCLMVSQTISKKTENF